MLSKTSLSLSSSSIPRPFLKWAGGKGKLVQQISNFFPEALGNGSITRYVEPFIGGGAILFHIAANYHSLEEIFIFDINPELILAYQTIKQEVDLLGEVLLKIQDEYWSLSDKERRQYYYQTRELFNSQKKQINYYQFDENWIQRTAQIIFLNRTCFNGLFRVNSQGYFNVPMGKYNKPKICNFENLRVVSAILQKVNIMLGDFTKCRDFIDANTFVYFDPPYRPISKTANFTAYSDSCFNDAEQLRLRDFFTELDYLGSKLLLSNSDPKNENKNDNFFDEAYSKYSIKRIKASRNINSKSSKRGLINELLIMNY